MEKNNYKIYLIKQINHSWLVLPTYQLANDVLYSAREPLNLKRVTDRPPLLLVQTANTCVSLCSVVLSRSAKFWKRSGCKTSPRNSRQCMWLIFSGPLCSWSPFRDLFWNFYTRVTDEAYLADTSKSDPENLTRPLFWVCECIRFFKGSFLLRSIYLFIYLFIHSFVRSFVRSLVHSFIHLITLFEFLKLTPVTPTVITLVSIWQRGLSKQCRPTSDATFFGVWCGFALFVTHLAIS